MDSNNKAEIKSILQRQLESLIYTGGAHSENGRNVGLDEIFVPLRSNVHVDIEIKDCKVKKLKLCLPQYCLVEIDEKDEVSDLISHNSGFRVKELTLLKNDVNAAVINGFPEIIKVSKRPFISSPYWADGYKEKLACLDVPSSVSLFKRVVLLGPPGSGKSTVLRAIAAQMLARFGSEKSSIKLDVGFWALSDRLPIFVELRSFVNSEEFEKSGDDADSETLLEYLKETVFFGNQSTFQHALQNLQNGTAVLLLDGLDEVPIKISAHDAIEKRRDQLKKLIRSISLRFENADIIVSSRPAGYSGWELEGFETIRMLPLDPHESSSLATAIYRSYGKEEEEIPSLVENLLEQLIRVPKTLSRQPLFLGLLAILFLEKKESDLPTKRGALLEETVKFLISSWSIKKHDGKSLEQVIGCSEPLLIKALSEIGFVANKIGEQGEENISRSLILDELFEIEQVLDFQKLFDFVGQHAGILISPKPREFRFAHGQFQEFFAANRLFASPDWADETVGLLRGNFSRWLEVTRILADLFIAKGQREKVWILVDELISENETEPIWLACNIFTSNLTDELKSDAVFSNTKNKIAKRCNQIIRRKNRRLSQTRVCDLVECLSFAGDTRKGVGVVAGLPDISWIDICGGEVTIGTSNQEIEYLNSIGSEDWNFSSEMPQHSLSIPPYKISKYPITNVQFKAFLDSVGGYEQSCWWDGFPEEARINPTNHPSFKNSITNEPATYVTWYEAVAFCRWLSSKAGKQISLPTEPQWEWAARYPDHSIYPWGNRYDYCYANTREADVNKVVGVGCFKENSEVEGVKRPVDMIGNCWEWCLNIVEAVNEKYVYKYDTTDGREMMIEEGKNLRATRGGYYRNDLLVARSAYRGRDLPSARLGRQGFRVVML